MRKLIEAIAQSSQAYPEFDAFREALFGVMEIEDSPKRIALGFGSAFISISTDKIEFVMGSDRISLSDLARIASLSDDLRQRLLMPYTAGTDEDYDVDKWVDGSPTMPSEIIGGWEPVEIDDEAIAPDTTWSSQKISSGLSAKLPADTIGNSPPTGGGLFWFEPTAIAPQPWLYKSNNWYSSAFPADFIIPGLGVGGVTMVKLIPPRIPRIFVEAIHAQLRSNGGSSSSTDFYTMTIRWFSRSGINATLLTFNNQNQTIGTSRFSTPISSLVLEDAAYIELAITRTGTNSAMSLTTGATIDLRYGR